MFRRRVQAYATGFYRVRGPGEAARLAEEAERHVANGFGAYKVKLGFGVADDLAVMRAIRQVAGKCEVMIDTNHAYGVAEAIRLGRGLEEMGWRLRWYEEPVTQEDLDGYGKVRRALATPIAGGENEYTAFGFRNLLAARAVDIAQPDLCIAGGFTACRHIVALAHAHGVQVNPHVWASAVGQAASLQFIASIPVANHSLFPSNTLLEFDTSSHPFREHLTDLPLRQRAGWVDIPSKPGLGIEVDRKVLEKYAV
jgi:D-galactarolactone cycloisomerase